MHSVELQLLTEPAVSRVKTTTALPRVTIVMATITLGRGLIHNFGARREPAEFLAE